MRSMEAGPVADRAATGRMPGRTEASATTGRAEEDEGAPLEAPILQCEAARATHRDLFVKRAMDLTLGVILALLTAPIWLIAALAIRLDSPGSVLFRQERVGSRPVREGGELRWRIVPFTIYKFRTMRADADPDVHRAAVRAYAAGARGEGGSDHAPYKLANDARVTRVGVWLRRTSLDELPQLINVLQGTMSLVGPRPLPRYEVAEYDDWHYERMCALPGITGRWQVEGRGRTSFDEGTRMDIDYVRAWWWGLDLALLVRTIPAVLSRRGAA